MATLKPTPPYNPVEFIRKWREHRPEWKVGDIGYIMDTGVPVWDPRWPDVPWFWRKVQLTGRCQIEGYGHPLWEHNPCRQTTERGGSWEPSLFRVEDVEVG